MIPNKISYTLDAAVVTQIIQHLNSIEALMPFLLGLSGQERQRLNNAGDASQAFVRKGANVAPMLSEWLPAGLNVAEMNKDIALMDALQPIRVRVESLAEKLSDTQAVVASEAYSAALHVYRAAKLAQGPEGLEDTVRELARRFARSSSPKGTDAADADKPKLASDADAT